MVSRPDLVDFVERLTAAYDPERVVLFGSYARQAADADSDIDLLVVLPLWDSPLRVSVEILNRLQPRFPIDLLARSPDDTRHRYLQGDPLIREALDFGEVLYERDSPGVAR